MPRSRRPHMPGVVFHLTARIQCREALLCGIEASVVAMIREATARSDARLVAWAVMPNHLHVLLQQGSRPLSHYMQPLLRRVALTVRRARGWEGHVFERRYRESACVTPDYLRNAIAYVHLNGFRAALASAADEYEWCSQQRFCDSIADDATRKLRQVRRMVILRAAAARYSGRAIARFLCVSPATVSSVLHSK